MGDLQTIFEIGPMVWRVFGRVALSGPYDEIDPDMLEPWAVDRVTPEKVYIRSYLDPANPPVKAFVLSRSMLQRHGWAVSSQINNEGNPRGGRFLTRRPEAYRKKTVGYLLRGEAKAVLGLKADASEADVRAAYLRLVKQHHPDRPNGDQELFMRIQDAYEDLGKPLTIDAILKFIRDVEPK